jgi:hypothetical protein
MSRPARLVEISLAGKDNELPGRRLAAARPPENLDLPNLLAVRKQRGAVLVNDLMRLAERCFGRVVSGCEKIRAYEIANQHLAADLLLYSSGEAKLVTFALRRRKDRAFAV